MTPDEEPAPLRFTLREGDVLYLGNVHMALTFGKNVLGAPVTTYVQARDPSFPRPGPQGGAGRVSESSSGQAAKRALAARGPWVH